MEQLSGEDPQGWGGVHSNSESRVCNTMHCGPVLWPLADPSHISQAGLILHICAAGRRALIPESQAEKPTMVVLQYH